MGRITWRPKSDFSVTDWKIIMKMKIIVIECLLCARHVVQY